MNIKVEHKIKRLFDYVEKNKKTHSLLKIFENFGQENKCKTHSVRNLYYSSIDILEKDETLCQKLGINLRNHKKQEIVTFNKLQSLELKSKIEELLKKGYSVRKACLELSNGDIKDMIRFQNKYRSILGKKDNVVQMPQRKKKLTDDDINSLFLGLVKLVKKTTIEEIDEKYKKEVTTANQAIREMMVSLSQKEREVTSLKRQFALLKKEKEMLKNKLMLAFDKSTIV